LPKIPLTRLNRLVLVWAIIGLVFWGWYNTSVAFMPQFLYFYIWTAGVGTLVWLSRDGLEKRVKGIRLGEKKRFVLLGYAMVLAEEIVAAFVNNLSEGFTPQLFAIRVLQFWAFNLLAFTGWILTWMWMSRSLGFSMRERFYLSGLFGLYAEKTIYYLFSNPLAFFFTAPLELLTYGLILTPAQLSVTSYGGMKSLRLVRYIVALALPILVSVPFVLVLTILRSHFPWAFPPLNFIA
jgi:hypothetical protein